jgi:hypothetical protein
MSGQGERQAAETEKGDPFLKGSPCHATLAGLTGLEPATSGVTGRRCNRLYYSPWLSATSPEDFLVGETGLEPVTLGL